MDESRIRTQPPGEAAFLSPAIQLYRVERAKAVERGADLTGKHPHSWCRTRYSEGEFTSRPAIRIGDSGDGCYLIAMTPR